MVDFFMADVPDEDEVSTFTPYKDLPPDQKARGTEEEYKGHCANIMLAKTLFNSNLADDR